MLHNGVYNYMNKETNKSERIFYPGFHARLSQDNIDWLKKENKNYDSWNKFFNQLRKSYHKK